MDRFGYAKTVDVATYERNKEAADAENKWIVNCINTGKLCVFTNTGKMHQIKVLDLPYGCLLYTSEHDKEVLVIGLGNRQATPDALGPYVADNLNVTRHIVKEYGKYAALEEMNCVVSAIVPGVMAQTGMETAEIIKGVVRETKPDLLIVIDALAARNSRRLNRTIQIADTGINPGSGVGNYRNAITKETIGVPVIAIGVPTVVDAVTIVSDTMENLLSALETSESLKGVGLVLGGYSEAEKYELIKELIAPNLNSMFMTPKDIDETVKRLDVYKRQAFIRLELQHVLD